MPGGAEVHAIGAQRMWSDPEHAPRGPISGREDAEAAVSGLGRSNGEHKQEVVEVDRLTVEMHKGGQELGGSNIFLRSVPGPSKLCSMDYPTLPIGFQTGHPLEGPGRSPCHHVGSERAGSISEELPGSLLLGTDSEVWCSVSSVHGSSPNAFMFLGLARCKRQFL